MLGKALLFLSSYCPLFALLAIRFEHAGLWVACSGLALVGLVSLVWLLHLDGMSSAGSHRIATVRDAGDEAAAYLASYLLPFLTVDDPSVRDLIAYAGFVAVAGMVYARSPLIQINPLLFILKYRILAVSDDAGLKAYLITKRTVRAESIILATRFGDDVLVDRTPEDVHPGDC